MSPGFASMSVMPKHYNFQNLDSPTRHQLDKYLSIKGWHRGENPCFSDANFDFPELEILEYKHLLARFLAPDLEWMQAPTRELDDSNYLSVLTRLPAQGPWILKPALMNNGQAIHLFLDKQQVLQHFSHSKRYGGPHILQDYIHPPHLLQGPRAGHKYSLRLFIVMTSRMAYLYPHGYFNIALQSYDFTIFPRKEGHLTNEHLCPGVANVVQIPTQQYSIFQQFWPQIFSIFQQLSQKFLAVIHQDQAKIGFLGMDLMVDANERVWLLELNDGPCFPKHSDHPLYSVLYHEFWQAVIHEIIEPYYLGLNSATKVFCTTAACRNS